MAAIPPEKDRFHDNVVDMVGLLHELISLCHEKGHTTINPALVTLAGGIIDSYDRTIALENFINYSYDFWDQILSRDETFFGDNCARVFRDLPVSHVGSFKVLFEAKDQQGQPIISPDDREAIWAYFDALIKICIKYVHLVRIPKMRDLGDDQGSRPTYGRNKFASIKVQHYANIFKVDLSWPA